MTDYDAIRNLLARYSHSADDKDYDACVALFAEGGELVEQGIVIPRDKLGGLMRMYSDSLAKQPQPVGGKHLQMNTVIEVNGDTAHAVSDLLIVKLRPEGWSVGGSGRYTDELVKVNGAWLFKRRTTTWHMNLPPKSDSQGDSVEEIMEKSVS